jgi:hypothetical protein
MLRAATWSRSEWGVLAAFNHENEIAQAGVTEWARPQGARSSQPQGGRDSTRSPEAMRHKVNAKKSKRSVDPLSPPLANLKQVLSILELDEGKLVEESIAP